MGVYTEMYTSLKRREQTMDYKKWLLETLRGVLDSEQTDQQKIWLIDNYVGLYHDMQKVSEKK
jgi:hypothetical protein